MIARRDTQCEAIRAMWRQRQQFRKIGSSSRNAALSAHIDPEEEVLAINRRIRLVIKAMRGAR